MQTENQSQANGEDTSAIAGFAAQVTDDPVVSGSDASETDTSQAGDVEEASDSQFEIPADLMGDDGALDKDKVAAHLQETAAQQAARIEKYGDVPEGDYDLTIDVDNGEGEKLAIDAENPILKDVLSEMKEMQFGQKAVTNFLSKYAQAAAADGQKIASDVHAALIQSQKEAVAAEIKSLGDEGGARIKAVTTKLSEHLGDEASANTLLNQVRTKAGFELLERLVEKASGEGSEAVVPASQNQHEGTRAERLYPNEGTK